MNFAALKPLIIMPSDAAGLIDLEPSMGLRTAAGDVVPDIFGEVPTVLNGFFDFVLEISGSFNFKADP